jgi:hypothetical protein
MMKPDLLLPKPRLALRVQMAETRSEYASAFELLYQLYLIKGYTRPHPSGLLYNPVFGLPTSRTLIAVDATDVTVGCLSVVGDSDYGLPMESTYHDEVDQLRREGRRVAEVAGLSVASGAGRRPREIFFALTEFMIQYAYWRQLDDLVMVMHPRHYRFYWECFRAAPIGPCREHKSVCGNPAIACRIDLGWLSRNVEPVLWQRYFSRSYSAWSFEGPAMSAIDHEYFCHRRGIADRAACVDSSEPLARAG